MLPGSNPFRISMKKSLLLLLAGSGLLGLAGCATQNVNTVERAQAQANPNYIADKRVITDYSLAKTVRILSVNEGVVSSDLKKIQVMLENLSSDTVFIRYRFEWYDHNGMQLQSPTDLWKPFTLQGRETAAISTVATNPTATDFTLKIQEIEKR